MGYYQIAEETEVRLLLSPPPGQRQRWALIFGGMAVLFALLELSLLRSRPPEELPLRAGRLGEALSSLFPYLVYPTIALGFLVAAALAWGWWSEIELDAVHRRIMRRRLLFGRVLRTASLPFERVDEVRVVRVKSQYSLAYYHLLIHADGSVWARLPGYRSEKEARRLGRRLLSYMGQPLLGSE